MLSIAAQTLPAARVGCCTIRSTEPVYKTTQVGAARVCWLRYQRASLRRTSDCSFAGVLSQHAVPLVAITQIQSDGQFLPRNIPALLCHCGANLLHCRSPFSLCLEHVDTWERTASRRRPAFSSHLLTTIMINFRRSSGGKPKRSARGSALDARRVARDAERNPPSVLQTLLGYGKSGTVSRYLSVFESVCVWQRLVSYQSARCRR